MSSRAADGVQRVRASIIHGANPQSTVAHIAATSPAYVLLPLQVLELGASIIHGANQYMLSLAREMNLTLSEGDDTGAAFSIWNGNTFVFSQVPDQQQQQPQA
jgi:hypothetical protein